MRASYSIFPLSGYVLESIRGSATADELIRFAARQQRDVRRLKCYHTLSDYSRAKPCLSIAEVQQLAEFLYAAPLERTGRHALVVIDARNYVFATALRACLAGIGIESQCFGRREAALSWLLAAPQARLASGAATCTTNRCTKADPESIVRSSACQSLTR